MNRREGEEWTEGDITSALRFLLPSDSQERFNGLCVFLGNQQDRSAKSVRRFLWGLATRMRNIEYAFPEDRWMFPFTWTEKKMIGWASSSNTHDRRQKQKPDAEYLAKIMGRRAGEIECALQLYGPAKGRLGFGL